MKAGRPPYCNDSGRMSGVGPQVRPAILAHLGLSQLRKILRQLPACVAPGEVVVRLREAKLCQTIQHLGPGECLSQEERFRVLALDLGDHPLPKRKRFGVRIVYPEDMDALFTPVEKDTLQLFPKLGARPKIRSRTGRCPGTSPWADSPRYWIVPSAPAEPLRVFGQVRMVARCREGDVERVLLQPVSLAACTRCRSFPACQARDESPCVRSCGPDSPGTARITWPSLGGVVAPLGTAAR